MDPAAFWGCTALKSITVDKANAYFTSEDGVLIQKVKEGEDEKLKLFFYPQNKAGEEYTVPDGIYALGNDSFYNGENLKKLTLSSGVQEIDRDAFANTTNIEEICVDSGNNYFKAVDGVLYSYDMKEMRYYPIAKKDTSFELPESVTSIATHAITKNPYVQELVVSSPVSKSLADLKTCRL